MRIYFNRRIAIISWILIIRLARVVVTLLVILGVASAFINEQKRLYSKRIIGGIHALVLCPIVKENKADGRIGNFDEGIFQDSVVVDASDLTLLSNYIVCMLLGGMLAACLWRRISVS